MRYFTLFSKKICQVMSKKLRKISEVTGDRIQKSIFSKQKKSPSSGFEERSK
jgi:hypothetical protein